MTGRAVQFIAIDSNRQLQVKDEAIQLIRSFQQQVKNFAVMVVVGKYRTGKSYLVNQVLLGGGKGFDVGSTINACTKGLWMWSELIYFTSSKSNEPIPTLLLDTEGIGSVEEEQNHDVKIFLLAMLLSSYFIYNSVGTIDDMALQNLGLIVNLTKFLQRANEEDQKDIFESFPSFLWILRDFSLKLEDELGNKITSKEYLENALKPLKGFSEAVENKNKLRRHIMQFFGERDCFTLVRPVQDEKQLQQLANLDLDQLRPEFQEQVCQLRKKFSFKVHLKQYKNKPVTPYGFIEMCKHFVDSINSGNIPAIQTQWNAICSLEMKRIYDEVVLTYEKHMEEFMKQPGITRESIEVRHALAVQNAKQQLEDNCLDKDSQDFKTYKKQLKQTLEQKIKHFLDNHQELLDLELSQIKQSYLYQVQVYESQDFWDLGQFGLKIILEFIEQGGSGEHLSQFIKDLWAELVKQLGQEIYSVSNKVSQAQDEVIQAQLAREECQKEIQDLKDQLAKQRNFYEAKLLQSRLDQESETKKSHSMSMELKKIQMILESRNQEFMDKLKQIECSYEDQLNDKIVQMANMENRLKKALIESDKSHAIIKQRDNDIMNIEKDHRMEIQKLNDEIIEKQEQLNRFKEEYQNKGQNFDQFDDLRDLKCSTFTDCSESISPHVINEWRMQKEFLEKQLKNSQAQLDDHKRFNDALISTILTSKQKTTEQNNEQNTLIATNNRLAKAVEMAEARCKDLEQQVIKFKKFQKLLKMSNAVECRVQDQFQRQFCMKQQKTNFFEAHLAICKKRNTQKSKSGDLSHPQFELALKDNNEFQITVQSSSSNWVVTKTTDEIKLFADLVFISIKNKMNNMAGRQYLEEPVEIQNPEYLRQVLHFFNEISFQKELRSSSPYQNFFQEQYPVTSELCISEKPHKPKLMSMDYNQEDDPSPMRKPLQPTQKKSLLQMFQQQKMKDNKKIDLRRSNKHA